MHETHWCTLSTAYFADMNSALIDKVKKKRRSQLKKRKRETQNAQFSSVSKWILNVFNRNVLSLNIPSLIITNELSNK